MAIFPGSAIPSAADDAYTIDNSLRWNSGDSAKLTRTPGTATSNQIGTLSWWMKLGDMTDSAWGLSNYLDEGNRTSISTAGNALNMFGKVGSTANKPNLTTTQLFRDTSAWYHIVYSIDVSQSTASDRIKLYVNGEQVTSFSSESYPDEDVDFPLFSKANMLIGARYAGSIVEHTDGYMAEFYYVDGTALAPSTFGELDSTTNQWKPLDSDDVKDAVEFGTNGFYQKYNSSELDASFEDSIGPWNVTAFTSTGANTWTCPVGVTSVEVLVVAGGGGGGSGSAGGGGAGGLVNHKTYTTVPGVEYDITVGAGGTGGTGVNDGNDGSDSVFNVNAEGSGSTMTALGGGGGGYYYGGGGLSPGNDGGSGGGAGYVNRAGGSGTQGDSGGGTGYGNDGGSSGSATDELGAGGGGAGAVGQDSPSDDTGGDGGDGLRFYKFSGYGTDSSNVAASGFNGGYFAGGGGGTGSTGSGASGGVGGGANGVIAGVGLDAQANTGGGGSAARSTGLGGTGGSGIVAVAYFDASATSTGGHTITATNAVNQRPQPHDLTANGHAHLIGPKVGTSVIHFAGGGQYLSMPDSSDWQLGGGTGDFTVECWMNPLTPATEFKFFGQRADDNNRWYMSYYQSKFLFYAVSGGSTVADFAETTAGSLKANTWSHVAFVRSGSTGYLFVNGVSQPLTETTAFGTQPDVSAVMCVGRFDTTHDGQDFVGSMGPVRISNSARYTADFDVPTTVWENDGNTKLLIQNGTDGSQTFDDLSTGDHTITAEGSVRWFAPKVGAGAMEFDGDDYFSSPTSSDWNLWTSGSVYTLEAWVKCKAVPSGSDYWSFITQWEDDDNKWQCGYDHASGGVWWYLRAGGSTVASYAAGTISDTDWHHIAWVKNGSSLKAYLDGTGVIDETDADNDTFSGDLNIGTIKSGLSGNAGGFVGYMDGIRISKAEIYTEDFDPPTTAFTDSINTALILDADINQGTWAEDISTGLAISTESRMKMDSSGDYLSVASSDDWAWGTDNFTVEAWANLDNIGSHNEIINCGGQDWRFAVEGSGYPSWNHSGSGAELTSSVLVSVGQWFHLAVCRSSGTSKMFLNGVEVASASDTHSYVADALTIGAYSDGNYGVDGYMDEVRISDNARYTSAFTPQTRGNPFTADANTSLLIHSDYTGGLGADSSGNFNNFAATNLVATDQMVDTPTNNFATFNPAVKSYAQPTYSEGNLKGTPTSEDGGNILPTTWLVESGKWYWEIRSGDTTGGQELLGIASEKSTLAFSSGENPQTASSFLYISSGSKRIDGTVTTYGSSYTSGDIIGIALNMTDREITFYKNDVSQTTLSITGDCATGAVVPCGISAIASAMYLNAGADSSFAGTETAQGNQDGNDKGDFYYEPPSGFLALCTDNLSAPEIALPEENFLPKIYTGDGASKAISVGFKPDMVWIKGRNNTEPPVLFDSIRGALMALNPSDSTAESSVANSLTSFDSSGFTVNSADQAGGSYNYVSWNWLAGGTPTADNDNTTGAMDANSVALNGSLQAAYTPSGSPTIYPKRMSINTTSGFSIVRYDGNTTAGATIPHGLSTAPAVVIVKDIDSGGTHWYVGNPKTDGWDAPFILNLNGAGYDDAGYFNDTAPGNDLVTLGTYTDINGTGNLAYCFQEIEGYSSMGTYTGNNSSDGTFVYTGLSPSWLLLKAVAVQNWALFDSARQTYNLNNKYLTPNGTGAETTGFGVDFLSNGFKLRTNDVETNGNGTEYFYMAFAESPFKTSNAR